MTPYLDPRKDRLIETIQAIEAIQAIYNSLGDYLTPILLLCHGLGIVFAISAVFKSRTPQGAIAWSVSLAALPYLAVPLYFVFGNHKFYGYVRAHKHANPLVKKKLSEFYKNLLRHSALKKEIEEFLLFEKISGMPITKHNNLTLLIDGQNTFQAIFEEIKKAQNYILVLFYIVRDDHIGKSLAELLVEKSLQGVKVYFLYDEIGCYGLSTKYQDFLIKNGVKFEPFNTGKGYKIQINFRNHRKVVIIDGETSFLGGHNVGDEYMGQNPNLGPWRDTHLKIVGPASYLLQLMYIEDWHWSTNTLISKELDWTPIESANDESLVCIFPTGPSDQFENCSMMFTELLNRAQKRFWISSPYFVPDHAVLMAFKKAALKGVDVRILIPDKADHILVYMASFEPLQQAMEAGVKVYRYQDGFLHGKCTVIDDDLSTIGTANLDNRSFSLNFEVTALMLDVEMNRQVSRMFAIDFQKSRQLSVSEYASRSLLFKISVRIANLFSPTL